MGLAEPKDLPNFCHVPTKSASEVERVGVGEKSIMRCIQTETG